MLRLDICANDLFTPDLAHPDFTLLNFTNLDARSIGVYSDWDTSSGRINGFRFDFSITSIRYVGDEPGESVAVSEPGTFALLALGLAGLGFAHRRRKQLDA